MSVEGGRGRSRRSLALAALAAGVMSVAAGCADATMAATSPVPTPESAVVLALSGRPPAIMPVPAAHLAPAGGTFLVGFCGLGSRPVSAEPPVFVVDGVRLPPGAQPSRAIRPEDLESVVILKGPKAFELYGPEAARGVVLITTKKSAR